MLKGLNRELSKLYYKSTWYKTEEAYRQYGKKLMGGTSKNPGYEKFKEEERGGMANEKPFTGSKYR